MALIKRCMGIKTKHPNKAKCQSCARLTQTAKEEASIKSWIDNPSMPCKDYIGAK